MKSIIIVLIIAILLLSGCSDEYSSFRSDCYQINKDKFQKVDYVCQDKLIYNNSTPCYRNFYNVTDYEKLQEFCYSEYKNSVKN